MVSTSDSDSGNPSSIPGTTSSVFFLHFLPLVSPHHSSFRQAYLSLSFYLPLRHVTTFFPPSDFKINVDLQVAGTLASPAFDFHQHQPQKPVYDQPSSSPIQPLSFHISPAVWTTREQLRLGMPTEESLVLPM